MARLPDAPSWLAAILPDASERDRYDKALRKLAMRPVSAWRLAQRAKLQHRRTEVRAALRADPRFMRVTEPAIGPERYVLRAEYRHARTLREARA